MSTHCWVALVADPEPSATVAAELHDATTRASAGWLCAWVQSAKPMADALRADPAAFDPDGPAANLSLVLVPADRAVLFDDPAVQRARQAVIAQSGRITAVTTLVSDPVHFRGSLLAMSRRTGWGDDPFARLAPARRLLVGQGLLSAGPPRLPAPVIERYAGKHWP